MISPCDLPRGKRSERVRSGEDLQLVVFEDTLQDSVRELAQELHIHGARVCVCKDLDLAYRKYHNEHVQLVACSASNRIQVLPRTCNSARTKL